MPQALSRRRGLVALAVMLAVQRDAGAKPQGWLPSRPLRLVVPSVAGSTPDTFCRLLAEEMRGRLLHPVVIENRPGGAGTIGLLEVARAAPDGHTIGYANVITLAINDALLSSQPYVIERDFRPVSFTGSSQNLLVARPGLQVGDLPGLVAALKRAPGRLTYGTPGSGTIGHLAGELFRLRTGTSMLHVPYRGSPQATQALAAGEVDLVCDSVFAVLGSVRAGDGVPLATTGTRRSPLFPAVPTMEEAGLAGFDMTFWGGLVVPAATPAAIIESLNEIVNAALASAALRARYAALGLEASEPGPPPVLFERAATQRAGWAALVRAAGVQMN
ncbi:Bug family tripartite tricarboxylate transporter substrate binding protein [Roseomonas sp. CCTCC AB2023176]|uniref:Bug family tripartite tricarboxylate transporter substrate binding protein n=1 Tax=Roseomonas sp. CCTCC AB2023176 TaxID=3342640 RepID=UPI0035D6BB08